MEDFEQHTVNTFPKKPSCWYRYVDDTFVFWPHGMEELEKFQQHLNNIHMNIKFTMERERNRCLPFLDLW
jgi:hypothetical protein